MLILISALNGGFKTIVLWYLLRKVCITLVFTNSLGSCHFWQYSATIPSKPV